MTAPVTTSAALAIDFAGEVTELKPGSTFTIGREGDLGLDDNPYLHRTFLVISFHDGLWWVHNAGSRLAAGLTDVDGLMRTTLAPGARLPVVFGRTSLTFSAGTTSYELLLECASAAYLPSRATGGTPEGDTTIAPTSFTESQLLVVLALAEPVLRRVGTGSSSVPTAVEAARRLGWAQTRFNRKLDNVCDKLDRAGVSGLRGTGSTSAANRRLRLVEYAVSSLLVTAADLRLLDATPTDPPGGDA
ncbi:hypothetical protein L2K70_12745 [Nocardioides KLBMP 9356]|uniref:FHA domain-containing protein n=1 Tax=Nocardioides potassii TaxID=2911371 RepID=A0ABS9HBC3_9ACTN|nr:FHA domain-containing protein [Nocardioides potassii]MCF6378472.1 hypothetical protein [Nocardioides potassii]